MESINFWDEEKLRKLTELRINKITVKEIAKIFNTNINSVKYAICNLISERVNEFNKKAFDENGKFQVKCKTCNVIKTDISDFRDAYIDGIYIKGTVDCNDCIRKKNTIRRYKRDYGIILDINSMFDSYDILQWYKWTTIDKTPNGKTLKTLPKSLITKENIAIIGRYVINNILEFNTRDEILNLSFENMRANKIDFSDTKWISSSPYNLVSIAFPELNIKGFEMNYTPSNYWSKRDNFLEGLKYYYVKMKVKFPNLNVSHYFTKNSLLANFRPLLVAKGNYYKDARWEDLLKELNIREKFMSDKYSYDEIKFSSIEEKNLYEFVHKHLNLRDFTFIGNNRSDNFTYYDSFNGVRYFPDFYLKKDNKIYIIEYFGMWKEKSSNEVFISYKEKTINKIKFFNNIKDIIFIPLFPNDCISNYNGLIEKFKHHELIK